MYLGVDYFPLRKEFCDEDNHSISYAVKSVLITTGSTDSKCVCLKILETLSDRNDGICFDVLLGCFFEDDYVAKLRLYASQRKNVKLITWGQNMAKLYKQEDIVIAPGSTTIFEALSMNVPCLSFEFIENQHEQCLEMDKRELVPYVGNLTIFGLEEERKLLSLFKEELRYETRLKQSKRFSALCDKCGASRIANLLLKM